MRFWQKAFTITGKDIRSQMRTREIIFSVLVFAILVIVIFNFAFNASRDVMLLVAPGILWVTFTFAGVLSLNQSFVMEKEQGCLEGLMVCPVGRDVIYVGKMLATLIFMLFVEAVTMLIFSVLFNIGVFSAPLIVVTVLGTVGFASVGTLFSALAVNTRAREMVMPVLFLPVVVPVIIAAVKATGLVLSGESWGGIASWLQIIGAFDIIFIVASVLVFAYVIEE